MKHPGPSQRTTTHRGQHQNHSLRLIPMQEQQSMLRHSPLYHMIVKSRILLKNSITMALKNLIRYIFLFPDTHWNGHPTLELADFPAPVDLTLFLALSSVSWPKPLPGKVCRPPPPTCIKIRILIEIADDWDEVSIALQAIGTEFLAVTAPATQPMKGHRPSVFVFENLVPGRSILIFYRDVLFCNTFQIVVRNILQSSL